MAVEVIRKLINGVWRTVAEDAGGGGGGEAPYVTGSGSPIGVVTPTADKPLYIDTTNGGLYLAFGATNVDWVVVGVVTGNVGEARGLAVTKGDGGIFVLSGDRDVAANTPVFIGTAYALWNGHSQGLQWNPGAAEGDEFLTVTTGATGQFTSVLQDGSGTMTLADGGLIFPSADPGVVGAWWDDAGTLARSGEAGPTVGEGHYQGVTASIATGASAKIGWTFEDGDALLDLTNPLQPLIVQDGTYALSFAVVTGSLSPGGYYNVNVDLERGPNSLFHGLSVPVNPATETSFSVTLGLQTGDKVNITIDNGDGALSRIITMNRAILVKLA